MNKQRKGINLVPMTIDGKLVHIDASKIAKKDRTMHHGQTADGTKVNSSQSCTIGQSTIVWAAEGAPGVSFLNTDLEVLATQTLSKAGFKIQPPQQQ